MTNIGWDPNRVPAPGYEAETRVEPAGNGLRLFQVLTAVCGAVLFGFGLVGVFRVDFGAGFFDTSASVAGFGFSPALALAGILLGAGILVAALADADRGGAAVLGFLALVVGVASLLADRSTTIDFDVDRGTAAVFVVLGAVAFVLSLVPWWSGRRTRTVVRG